MSWRNVSLGDAIRLKRGHDLPTADRVEGDVPIVSSSGVTGFHNVAKIAGPGVVTGRYGTLGEVHYIEGDYWPLNTALYVEDFKGNFPRYVAYLLMTLELGAQNAAGAVPGVNRNALHQLSIRIPDLVTQRAIALTLATYDDLIATNQRRIALLEQAARLLYREWFVNLRFPGHELVPVKEGLPDGWRKGTLDEALFLQRGFDLPNGARLPGEVPVYASTGINGFHNEARVQGPGVVTGRSGTLGQVHYVAEDYWPLNTALWVKEFRQASPLLAYFMLSEMNLAQFNSGASVPTLDRKTAHQAVVLIPPASVVGRFDQAVQPMFDQIQALRLHVATTTRARDLLLPKLMSGQLDVSRIPLPEDVPA